MNSDEIKRSVSMFEVARRYNLNVRRDNMCSCPFHGRDKHPSMKIYKDGYKCFACGSAGDIFKFVQEYEHCDFKTAFQILGGTYSKPISRRQAAVAKMQREHAQRQREINKKSEAHFREFLCWTIELCRQYMAIYPHDSDEFMTAAAYLPMLEEAYDAKYIRGEVINCIDVHRQCKRVEQELDLQYRAV